MNSEISLVLRTARYILELQAGDHLLRKIAKFSRVSVIQNELNISGYSLIGWVGTWLQKPRECFLEWCVY